MCAKPEDLPRFHGSNERISEANLVELIGFYHRLVLMSVRGGYQRIDVRVVGGLGTA